MKTFLENRNRERGRGGRHRNAQARRIQINGKRQAYCFFFTILKFISLSAFPFFHSIDVWCFRLLTSRKAFPRTFFAARARAHNFDGIASLIRMRSSIYCILSRVISVRENSYKRYTFTLFQKILSAVLSKWENTSERICTSARTFWPKMHRAGFVQDFYIFMRLENA